MQEQRLTGGPSDRLCQSYLSCISQVTIDKNLLCKYKQHRVSAEQTDRIITDIMYVLCYGDSRLVSTTY